MSTQSNAYCYGSAALKIDAPYLVLHEGGNGCPGSRRCKAGDIRPMGVGALLICVLVCASVFAGAFLLQDRSVSVVSQTLGQLPTSEHVVRDGETLWGIASDCGLDGVATRDVVDWIQRSNSLEDGSIHAGQRLAVPHGDASPR